MTDTKISDGSSAIQARAAAFLEAHPLTDDASEELDEMVVEMANHVAAETGNTTRGNEDFDDLHDKADAHASGINNEGHEAQIAYLIGEGCSEDYIRQTIFGDAESAPTGP
jgi:hypothetical protein